MKDAAFPIPASVPKTNTEEATANANGSGGTTDVQGAVVQNSTKLEQGKDARQTVKPVNNPAVNAAMPSNHDAELKAMRDRAIKQSKKRKKKEKPKKSAPVEEKSSAPADSQPASTQPQSTQQTQ